MDEYYESYDGERVMMRHTGSTVARSLAISEVIGLLEDKDCEIARLRITIERKEK